MGKIILSIGVSLDGFIDHTEMIADDEALDYATEILNNADAILFGRKTYQLLGEYWPTAANDPAASKSVINFADRVNSMPKMVCSQTLKNVTWDHTTLIPGDAVEEVSKLRQQTDWRILLGGSALANSLIQHGLIDEFQLRINPFLLGQGTPLFRVEFKKIPLKLAEVKTLRSGIVSARYTIDSAT